MSPLPVSVIVPTFNRASLLRQTLDSILAQTFEDFEVIVIDNMSTDGTEALVRGLDSKKVRYLQNRFQGPGVIASNRNIGIQNARGAYIAFCDHDDLWSREKLSKQISLMQREPSIGLCYTNGTAFDDSGTVREWMTRRTFGSDCFKSLLRGNFIPTSSVIARKSVFDSVGLHDTDPDLQTVEDYELWLRIAFAYPVAYIDEPLIRYRIHGNAASSSRAPQTLKSFRALRRTQKKLRLSPTFMSRFYFIHGMKYCFYRLLGI